MWTIGTWPFADQVAVSGNGWRLAALGSVTATSDELYRAGAYYDRTLDPAALSDLPCGAHVVWSDTATDLGDTVIASTAESPIFYTEHREGWFAASASAPLARLVGDKVEHLDGIRCTHPGHVLVLTALGTVETR